MHKQRLAGFTLIELVVVICLVSVIATVAADRLFYYQERAEKAALQLTLAGVKTGLQIRMAELIIANRQPQIVELEMENPLQWLQEPPANYLGEYAAPAKPGHWYYAASEHELVYVPINSAYLDTGQSGKELRFRIAIRYETNVATGGKIPAGLAIVPVQEFKWF